MCAFSSRGTETARDIEHCRVPTNRPEPAGTASIRNWLSLRTSDFVGELATFASVLVRIISLSVPGLGAPVRHSYSNRIVTTHFMLRHAEP